MKIAIIEDEKDHFELMNEAIIKGFPDSEVDFFEKADLLLASLDLSACGDAQAGKTIPDIIIADYLLSGINGLELFEELKRRKIDIPFIIVTAHGNEDIAVKAMKLGAYDYIVKSMNFFDLLPEIIRRTLRDRELKKKAEKAEESLRESEKRYKTLFEESRDAIYITNRGRVSSLTSTNLGWISLVIPEKRL